MQLHYQLLSTTNDSDSVTIALIVPEDLYYFDGHFDAIPVLPGVVQLHWVMELAKQHFGLAGAMASIESMKFTHIIHPGATLSLQLRYAPAKELLTFTYSDENHVYSTGKIKVT